MDDLDSVTAAMRLKSWYAFVAFGLMILLQIVRKHPLTSPYWQKIPNGWRFLPGTLAGFATGFLQGYHNHLPVMGAVITGLGGIAGITIPAMGLAAGTKESHLPWDGGAGGAPKRKKLSAPVLPALALGLALFCLPLATGCRGPASADTAAMAVRAEHAAFNAAVVAWELMDQAEADRLHALGIREPPATATELAAAEARVARLKRAKEALGLARAELLASSSKDATAHILAAADLIIIGVDEARADGMKIPDSVRDSLVSARALLGGAS